MGRRFAAALVPWVVVGGFAAACGGPAKEGGSGSDCFRVSDCAAGLVCIDHKCTNDLSSIVVHDDGGTVTGVAVGAGGAMGGAGGTAAGSAGTGGMGGTANPGGAAGQPVEDASAE